MARRKVIKSVLWNFLATYISRYTEYRGFWLFGFLVNDLGELEVDLLDQGKGGNGLKTALETSQQLAAAKFGAQFRKAGLEPSQIREARLRIGRSPHTTTCAVNGHPRAGYKVTFRASARMDNGREYDCNQTLVVALTIR